MNVQPNGNPADFSTDSVVPALDNTREPMYPAAQAPEQRANDIAPQRSNTEDASPGSSEDNDLSLSQASEKEDNEAHIPGISKNTDVDFYSSLFSVDPKRLTDAERAFTDDYLESLTLVKLRELAGKMAHEIWEGAKKNKKNSKEGIPIHGTKGLLLGKIMAYYLFMRDERTTDRNREINTSPTFQPEEDARLIEILTDPQIFPDIKFAFQSGSRADIDSVAGSLVDMTWNAVIAGRYFNNFDGFQPSHRHTDPNDLLHAFDPNRSNICRRAGTALKSRFSTIRSRCTVINKNWSDSGKNDPDRFEGFCNLSNPLDRSALYMWLRIQEGGTLVSSRLLRLVPIGNDSRSSTRDNTELLRIMQGRDGASKFDDCATNMNNNSANNSNNGGSIGTIAQKKEEKKKRKRDDDESLAKIAETLHAIADPKGRSQARRSQLMANLDSLDQKMSTLAEELDPNGVALLKRGYYINRRRRLYREARLRRWICQRELEALEAGHDDVSALPLEEEPTTDVDEAEFLRDAEDSDGDVR